jgi:2-polyprenyl-3-methyl-5-hydroxy-6-metoxy-1,4-benzoquinol methylase
MPSYYTRRDHVALPDGAYWGKVADPDGKVRDLLSPEETARSIEDVKSELAYLRECSSVLDVGCGTGAALYALDRYGVALAGVEPDPVARLEAMRRVPRAAVVERLPDLPSSGRFAGLLCYHVIEHMTDPVAEMRRALAVLIVGARVVVSTPDFASQSARAWGSRYRMLHDRTHISLFSSVGVVEMLRDLGVGVERVEWPFYGTRFESEARNWVDTGDNFSPPALGNVVSIYGRKL